MVDYEALTWGPRGAGVCESDGSKRIFTCVSAQHDIYTNGLKTDRAMSNSETILTCIGGVELDAPSYGKSTAARSHVRNESGEASDHDDSEHMHQVPLDPMRAYVYIFERIVKE